MLVRTQCPRCKNQKMITVDSKGYLAWRKGELITRALPELSAEDRERLMTGYDGKCWDAMFPPEEDYGDS